MYPRERHYIKKGAKKGEEAREQESWPAIVLHKREVFAAGIFMR